MIRQPTGRLIRKDDGVYVVLDRIFRAPIEEVWSYFSRSPRLAQWIGEYTGTPSTGAVRFRMNQEGENAEWENVAILLCDAPHRLHVDVGRSLCALVMYVHLTEASGNTTVTFGQRMQSLSEEEANMGVGWDFYLDRLVAAHDDKTPPDWLEHYKTLCRELDHDLRAERLSAQQRR
ncbi:SRPBCC domain-containing protein [Leifsonia xyli]|uniref:SRPBCC domain-containing protein n=1 Tax=Leifsonia xyli TaxID=1575 RepID=UPI0005C4A262|nr:SRPBCC domain-containing protein [Leifsonia xyli]